MYLRPFIYRGFLRPKQTSNYWDSNHDSHDPVDNFVTIGLLQICSNKISLRCFDCREAGSLPHAEAPPRGIFASPWTSGGLGLVAPEHLSPNRVDTPDGQGEGKHDNHFSRWKGCLYMEDACFCSLSAFIALINTIITYGACSRPRRNSLGWAWSIRRLQRRGGQERSRTYYQYQEYYIFYIISLGLHHSTINVMLPLQVLLLCCCNLARRQNNPYYDYIVRIVGD